MYKTIETAKIFFFFQKEMATEFLLTKTPKVVKNLKNGFWRTRFYCVTFRTAWMKQTGSSPTVLPGFNEMRTELD